MKKIYIFIFAAVQFLAIGFPFSTVSAQAPNSMKYQTIVRDAAGVPLINTLVGMRISILQGSIGGTAVCVEAFTPTTNQFGLVTLEIGSVDAVAFAAINWGNGPYFMQVELDPAGGIAYTVMGTSQLLSVPYSLYAKNAENLTTSLSFDTENSIPIVTSADYTVPNNKNLLLSYISITNDPGAGNEVEINSNGILCFYFNRDNPLILSPGDQIKIIAGGVIMGQVIPLKYTAIFQSILGNPYTVPANKKLVLLGVYSDCITLSHENDHVLFDGVYVGIFSDPRGLGTPLILKAGTVISTSNITRNMVINGYLINE